MQTRCRASFSTDLAHYLEQKGFSAVSEAYSLEVFYQTCTGHNPKFMINLGKFQQCLKNTRLGHSRIFFHLLYSIMKIGESL